MCTVTYAPLRDGGHVITSNRDERTARHGKPAGPWLHEGAVLLAPKDALTGTTWIASSSLGRTVCLLNGAEGEMYFAPTPARSRGTVLMEAASSLDVLATLVRTDLRGVHPFTLISAEHRELWMMQWNGKERCVCTLDTEKAQVWSSTTLYTPEVRAQREDHFVAMLKGKGWPGPEDLWDFHAHPQLEDERQAVIMKREDELRTVSITQAVMDHTGLVRMRYRDLLADKERTHQIQTRPFTAPESARA